MVDGIAQQTGASHSSAVKKKIFLIDDHAILRDGLRKLIESEKDLEICGEASSGKEAVEGMMESRPHAVILDISLPGTNGIEWIKSFRVRFPLLKILVLSMHDEVIYAERALRAGAKGYVMKNESSQLVLEALRKVLDDKLFLSPSASARLLANMVTQPNDPVSGLRKLTDRELEILDLVGQGLSTAEISRKLSVSPKTVESHRGNLRRKLSLRSGAELIRFAMASKEERLG